MRIRQKIVVLTAVATLLPVAIIVGMTVVKKDSTERLLIDSVDRSTRESVAEVARNVHRMCQVAQALGVNESAARALLKEQISKIRLGEGGYVFVLAGSGANRGEYLVSLDRQRDGENIFDSQDASGRNFIQDIVRKALALSGEGVDFDEYEWQNLGEEVPRAKIVGITYFEPYDWVIGAGSYKDEGARIAVANSLGSLQQWSMIVGLLAIVASSLIAVMVGRRITAPIEQMVRLAERMAEGEINQSVDHGGTDETGELAIALNTMSVNTQRAIRVIVDNAGKLGDTARILEQTAESMTGDATDMTERAESVSAASEELIATMRTISDQLASTTDDINNVASSTEEMTTTISEIANNSESARAVTSEAVDMSKSASENVRALGDAADEIGDVVEVILGIAEQTKLLALNANIEAASAGDAGKGFAVVAGEVKDLAGQTNSALGSVKEKVHAIEGSTNSTVDRIGDINDVNQRVNQLIASIAAAIEEQAVTTKDIAASVAQAASGVSDVNQNVAQSLEAEQAVTTDIMSTSTAAERVLHHSRDVSSKAGELARVSEELAQVVAVFKL